ncbi:hypothetical protein ABT299_44830 [Spirillospora sp. NPDC000708]
MAAVIITVDGERLLRVTSSERGPWELVTDHRYKVFRWVTGSEQGVPAGFFDMIDLVVNVIASVMDVTARPARECDES